jgi:hypothetical protein
MKKSTRLIIAVILVILLSITAVSVWAAPSRVGSVPFLENIFTAVLTDTINFGTGTLSIEAKASDGGTMTVEKLDDPATLIGPAPDGWVFLLDQALDVKITNGSASTVRICVPQTPDMDNKTILFHFWDDTDKKWIGIQTTTTFGNPNLVCGTGTSGGQYALLGQ